MGEPIQHAFFLLLKAGLWGRELSSAPCFPLSKSQWKSLLSMASNHTVEGIVFEGMRRLPNKDLPPKDVVLPWTVRVDRIERSNQWMNKVLGQQVRFFHKHNISACLLKGQGLALCYDNPLRRVCGDIDWYFNTVDDYTRANQLISEAGIALTYTPGFSCNYIWNGCEIEHHRKMIDLYNPFAYRYLKRMEMEQFENRKYLEVEGEQVVLPAPLLTFVQVNAHILKHILSFGIGIRQLCDSARMCYTYHKQVDGNELKATYRRLGILRWVELLHAILVKFIGLPKEYLPFALSPDIDADWMMEEIWQAGNFGFHDARVDLQQERDRNERVDVVGRWSSNFRKYVYYAPMEAVFFPLTQLYSRYVK
ncbi:hypothetical protein FAZ19_23030 [Sphingobacterium alkalisoli]|uniref:Nucleotidyltransferase family protein n=1 Tax=Sphingobacterium alkalisoli TaxID=1874115 RepID=A0A4V5LWV7_9SPHI|nr:nucleotidyltransferase family protein [Sphingobacterium alkalisoli]TJY60129.1 hypothetical protein FAZ19_23030 [Sphingobacterium alkalisoli]